MEFLGPYDMFPCLRAHQAPDGGYKSFWFPRMREQDSTRRRTKIIKFAKIALTKSLLYTGSWFAVKVNSSFQRHQRANPNLFKTVIVCQLQAWQTLISPPTFSLFLLNLLSTVAQNFQISRLTKKMGWGREGRESSAQESLSPSDSPVEQPARRMTTGKIFPNHRPEWLNDDNSDCPLLRPVLQGMIAPSNINIPQLTVTGNPFAHLIKKGPSATPQKAPALKPIPSSPSGTRLSLGKYAVENPSPGTESLDQVDHDSDRKSPFTPPTQPRQHDSDRKSPFKPPTQPRQLTPDRPMPSFQAFLEARQQQRELSAGTPAVKETASKPRIYLAGLSTDYQDHLINIQQLRTYAKTYRQSWHYVVGLYIQSFRDPSAFQVAPHCWEKDAWKADMLEKNPGGFLIWPDPARGSIEHEIMEQLRGSELKRQAMEAAIVDWSHSCQPQEVINVMSKAGWTRRSEYVFGTNWSVMDTIKRMDEGPEKMSLLAKAKRESPLFFKKCMEDEMCGM